MYRLCLIFTTLFQAEIRIRKNCNFQYNTADTFCGTLRVLSEKLIEKYLNAAVVFFTPLHLTTKKFFRIRVIRYLSRAVFPSM